MGITRVQPAAVTAWLIVPTSFSLLLVFFVAFRSALIRIPIDTMNPWQKSGLGTLVALLLLLLQPFADRFAARRLGASRAASWYVFAGGVLSSALLFIPALGLFME
jgi:uncharacterized protein YqgC (DUF456 family)